MNESIKEFEEDILYHPQSQHIGRRKKNIEWRGWGEKRHLRSTRGQKVRYLGYINN